MADESLKITRLPGAKPVKLIVQLPADIMNDLELYAEFLSGTGAEKIAPAYLASVMISRFMGEDHAFLRRKKKMLSSTNG